MLYGIQPDRSVTGGSWYTDQDFDSQFVDTLVMMCHRFLEQKVLASDPLLCLSYVMESSKASVWCLSVWFCMSCLVLCNIHTPAPMSQYQKGKTNLDLLEQQTVSSSGINWAI